MGILFGFFAGVGVGLLIGFFFLAYVLGTRMKGKLQYWRDEHDEIKMHVVLDEHPRILDKLNYVIFSVDHRHTVSPRDLQDIL